MNTSIVSSQRWEKVGAFEPNGLDGAKNGQLEIKVSIRWTNLQRIKHCPQKVISNMNEGLSVPIAGPAPITVFC